DAPAPEGDDGGAAGQRLDRRDAEVLLARLHVVRARPVEAPKLLGGAVHEELYGGIGESAEALLLRAAPDDDQGAPGAPRGRDRLLVALVGNERADGEEEVSAALRAGPVEV